MSINSITGDRIASKANTKQFEDNYDSIFRKKNKISDEADIANDNIERDLNISRRINSLKGKEVESTGYCLECSEELDGANGWCNAECRDIWQKRRNT